MLTPKPAPVSLIKFSEHGPQSGKEGFSLRCESIAKALLIAITVVSMAISTVAQQDSTEVSAREIEEITVIGERSLLTMRNEIIREEDIFYRLFNELNSDDKFDINCRRQSNTRSLIPKRFCQPKFLKQHRQQSSRHALMEIRQAATADGLDMTLLQNGLDLLEPESELRQQLDEQYEAMNEEIFRIAMENPEYLQVLQKISQLRAEYSAARQLKFGKD